MSRLMLCGLMSWLILGSPAVGHGDDAEEKAVANVEKFGVSIIRKEKLPGKPVISLNFNTNKVTNGGLTDERLKELAPLKNLEYLLLGGNPVTDGGLKELAPLKKLRVLNLARTKVTDGGLKELATLDNLEELLLDDTKVTDVGLKELAPLKKLTSLHLSGPQMTDRALAVLHEINLLHAFTGAKTVTSQRPSKIEDVIIVSLSGTQVTDAGLKELVAFKNFTALYLSETNVTDAGLKNLALLKKLTYLELKRTKATNTGVKELQMALPKCEIVTE